ncbi:MAG TPA: 3-dehydroquinate synthase [Acidobacteriaceae bacterium]|nr:3-dehydroquinate synthase [Acidobacteriaceae bacterium]
MRKITVTTRSGRYNVSVGSGLLNSLSKRVAAIAGRKRIFLLTSPEIWALWGRCVQAALAPQEPVVLFLPAGERHKRMSQVERLTTEISKAGGDRSSLLIAFGGGVTGDVGGFVSAIYMRGIDYVQVPTTLLSQVDSSVGGKTGVNLQTGKNLVGCFYPPQEVVADIQVLSTLPQRELRAGIYESIKAGLIRDAGLFRFIENQREAIDRGDSAALEKMVAASIQIKADVVSEDEREIGVRMILNFGHTLGHAIEASTGYRVLLHGEAIAWGMIAALHISTQRGLVDTAAASRVEKLIRYFQPPPLPSVSSRRLLQAASGDKKNRAGVRRFVLLEGLGNAKVVEDVTDAELLAAIAYLRGKQ